jgi:hypothetical protein
LGLAVHLVKCVTWSPQGLNHSISLPPNFLTFNLGFHILGAPMGSTSFVKSFVAKVFHEDLMTIFSLFMLIDLQAIFGMLLLCYAQHPSYLFHTMFPSLSILQHYTKFNIRTIATLEMLLGVGSFSGFIDHLVHHHGIFHVSSGGLNFLFVI